MLSKLVSKPGETRKWIAVLEEGEEAKQSLLEIAKREKIEDASFVALGAFAKATVAYFDWQKKKYQDSLVDEQVEVITLVGDIVPDEKARPAFMPTPCWGAATARPAVAICRKVMCGRRWKSQSPKRPRISPAASMRNSAWP